MPAVPSSKKKGNNKMKSDGRTSPTKFMDLNITDLKNPRSPSRSKVRNEFDGFPATTFGKCKRSTPMAMAASTGLATANATLPTTFHGTVGKYSPWAAPAHHVVFNDSVPMEQLPARTVSALEELEYSFAANGAVDSDTLAAASTRGNIQVKSPFGPSSVEPLPPRRTKDGRRITATMAIYGFEGNSQRTTRNSAARNLSGAKVSTFGGASRDKAVYGGDSVKLLPGPGAYNRTDFVTELTKKPVSRQGMLGSNKGRSDIVVTKAGLTSQVFGTPPMSRAPSRADLETRRLSRLGGAMSPGPEGTPLPGRSHSVMETPGTTFEGTLTSPTRAESRGGNVSMNGTIPFTNADLTAAFTPKPRVVHPPPPPIQMLGAEYSNSHTHNVQLKEQEQKKRKILRVPENSLSRAL